MAPDLSSRSYTQLKRMGWSYRKLKEHSVVLGIPAGTIVPQMVLLESIQPADLQKGASSFLVPPDFSPRMYPHRYHAKTPHAGRNIVEHGCAMLEELQALCQLEWGAEFPKPISMEKTNGEWIIRFRNHNGDRTPSTIARGTFFTLLLCGMNAPSGDFRLPGSLTAQELGDSSGLPIRFDPTGDDGRNMCGD